MKAIEGFLLRSKRSSVTVSRQCRIITEEELTMTSLELRGFVSCAVVALSAASVQGAFVDITRPGDPVAVVSGFNQGDDDAGDPPVGEGAANAIDDTALKYLNFVDLSSGFSVTPSANPTNEPVVGLRLYTANDFDDRDPASFQLFGSNDSIDGPWEAIFSGNLSLPSDRNDEDPPLMIPPTGNLAADHQEVLFENDAMYTHYRVVFPTLKDAAAANSMQIAEVELLAVPEPVAGGMAFVGAILLAARSRARRAS